MDDEPVVSNKTDDDPEVAVVSSTIFDDDDDNTNNTTAAAIYPGTTELEDDNVSGPSKAEPPPALYPGMTHHDYEEPLKYQPHSMTEPATTNYDVDIDHDPDIIFADDENKQRGNWSRSIEFILAVVGMNVGLGNVWRFPYLVYKNGGAVFLIPYVIMMLLVGIPLTLLELGLGQFASRGAPRVWNCVPLFKGLGFCAHIGTAFLMIYYNVIIGWGFFYLAHSFASKLPYNSCDNWYNSRGCTNNSASADFFNRYMLTGNDDGEYDIGNIGIPWWPLILCLLASWVVVFTSLVKGVKSSGKVVYFTALWPYVVLIALLIRGCLLEGYFEGIRYYILVADWERLKEAQIWKDAASQIFFSLSLGGGPIITLASYNKFHNNVVRDSIIASVGNCLTSFFAGFVVFAFMGNLAHVTGKAVQDVTEAGPGLVFVVFPQAFANLEAPPFWNIIFFLMIVSLGFDSVFGAMEGFATAFMDEIPRLHRHKFFVYLIICLVLFGCGISMTTPGGIYVLTLLDYYATPYTLMIGGLFECIAIAWFYGGWRFSQDIQVMVGFAYGKWLFCVCIYFLTPCLILFAFVFEAVVRKAVIEGFPDWSVGLGYIVAMISIAFIPLVALYQLCFGEGGSPKALAKSVLSPTDDWGPALKHHRVEVASKGYVNDLFNIDPN